MGENKKTKAKAALLCEPRTASQRPTELGEHIDLVDLVPPKAVLQPAEDIWQRNKEKYRSDDGFLGADSNGYLLALSQTLEDCLSGLPEDFREYIQKKGQQEAVIYQGQPDYEQIRLRRALTEYDKFRKIREELKSFAKYFTNWRKHGRVTGGIGGMYGADEALLEFPKPQALYAQTRTVDGTLINVVPSGLSAALDGVIGERVRSCEICDRIFWARRKESETCSPPCANNLRVRRWRAAVPKSKEGQ
jgi:hypothetical protein